MRWLLSCVFGAALLSAFPAAAQQTGSAQQGLPMFSVTAKTSPCDNTNRIATTAFVVACATGSSGVASVTGSGNISASPTTGSVVVSAPDLALSGVLTTGGAITFAGSAATTFNVSGGSLTVPNATDTFALLAATQTLTSKTLTSPTINAGALSGTFTGTPTLSGNLTFSGVPNFTGTLTGTQTQCLGLSSGNALVASSGACGTGGGGGNVSTSGTITSGALAVWNGATTVTGTFTPTNNDLVYATGGAFANLATANSGVLVTSSGGVPSISTTLPTGLSWGGGALSGTFTGTPTFSGNLTFSGVPNFTGTLTGTQTQCLGLSSGNALVAVSGACGTSSGSVTSVAMTVPSSIFGISGSPITTSGTLALSVTGTSGGIPYFSSTSALASSALLAANQLVLGGGAGTTPATLGSLGTTTTVLHGNAAGAPSFGAVALTTDVSGTLPVGNGGTGLATGTSGGILGFTGSTTLASSAALTANALVLGGGAGATPTALGSLGTTTTLLHGNASGAPTFGAVALATDVSGNLPNANLATQTANTVLGALTATTPSGLAVPSCSAASSALTWTTGTGFGCNTISGSGTVNSGTANQAAFYASTGAAVSGSSGLTLSSTQLTAAAIGLGSDATGDIYYRNSSGNLTRLAIGGANTFLAGGGTTPAYTQPAFSNLSGQATNAQLATMARDTVKANITASTATPTDALLPTGCTDTGGNHLNYTTTTGFTCGTSSSGGSTTITPSAGLGNSGTTQNLGGTGQNITNGSTLFPQFGTYALTAAYTLNATTGTTPCISGTLCDTARLLLANGTGSIAFTVPSPAGTLQPYQIGDESGHGFTVTALNGTATFFGCVSGSPTTVTVSAGYTIQLVDQGSSANSYYCILAPETGGNQTPSLGWVAGVNPGSAIIAIVNQAETVTSITGTPDALLGAAGTVDVWDAPSGTACGSGTKVTTSSFNANTGANTNQSLLSANYSLASGHRLCLQTTGSSWTTGSSIATISVTMNP